MLDTLIRYIGSKLEQVINNKLYQTYFKGNEQLPFIIFAIVTIYVIMYMLSALNNLPLIVISGAVLGVMLEKRYNALVPNATT